MRRVAMIPYPLDPGSEGADAGEAGADGRASIGGSLTAGSGPKGDLVEYDGKLSGPTFGPGSGPATSLSTSFGYARSFMTRTIVADGEGVIRTPYRPHRDRRVRRGLP
jgi:hypothetical protein